MQEHACRRFNDTASTKTTQFHHQNKTKQQFRDSYGRPPAPDVWVTGHWNSPFWYKGIRIVFPKKKRPIGNFPKTLEVNHML